MTYLAFSFCALDWWHVVLAWLLPFLLGLLLGYALWAKYKKEKEALEGDVRGLNRDLESLKIDLDDCAHHKTELDSEIGLLKGQLRERDLQLSTLAASLKAANKKGDSVKGMIAGATVAGVSSFASKKVVKDDLKKIEGVGPKIETILNESEINSFSDLADTEVAKLKDILTAAGPRYKIARPDTWPEQAALARDGKWKELKDLQDYLVGGLRPTESMSGGEANKDDLKKIEGVGPKIEGLLNGGGIWTFSSLADAKVARLQEILNEAGPRYRIATPESWPEQSALARDGKWDELKSLQDRLDGGRIV